MNEIIRLDFQNDINLLQRTTFVEVIRAVVGHETLVTIFTKHVTRLVHQRRRGGENDDHTYNNNSHDNVDPNNVVPPNVWQLFPTIVDTTVVQNAVQRLTDDIGNNTDMTHFCNFLLMISPGLPAPNFSVDVPTHVVSSILNQIRCIHQEHSDNEARRRIDVSKLCISIYNEYGKEPYYTKLLAEVLHICKSMTHSRRHVTAVETMESVPLHRSGFMEIPLSNPTRKLTMCMHCRMVPMQFRFPHSFCIDSTIPPQSCIQKHQQMCHTYGGWDLNIIVDVLDEVIRLDFYDDVNVMERETFVDVIRAVLIHNTLVYIFTKNVPWLIRKKRGLTQRKWNDDHYIHPNVMPRNLWQLFPTTVEYDMVERALQRLANDIGRHTTSSSSSSSVFDMDRDGPNFIHFLQLISPGLYAWRKCVV
jgi:hypothetical protein